MGSVAPARGFERVSPVNRGLRGQIENHKTTASIPRSLLLLAAAIKKEEDRSAALNLFGGVAART